MLNLAPHFIFVVHVVVQSQHHNAHTVLRSGRCLLAIHLSVREKIAFQRFCHLLFHLFGCGSRVNRDDHTLADRERREFVFWHFIHAKQSQHEQNNDDEQCNGVVFQRPADPIHSSLIHNKELCTMNNEQ